MDNTDLDRLMRTASRCSSAEKLAELREKRTPSMTIIATKGTLDWRIRPSSSRAHGGGARLERIDVLHLLRPEPAAEGPERPQGEPARQSGNADEDAFGPEWFKHINWNIPNAVQGIVPVRDARHHAP
jgi:hypothetical protein